MEQEEYAKSIEEMLTKLEIARNNYHGATSQNKDVMLEQWTLIKGQFQILALSKPNP